MVQPNISPYWAAVAQSRQDLEDRPHFIASIEDRLRGLVGGRVCEVSREIAARRLVERTHRLATEEETAAFRSEQEARAREYQLITQAQKQQSVLVVSQDTLGQLTAAGAAVAAAQGPAADNKPSQRRQ